MEKQSTLPFSSNPQTQILKHSKVQSTSNISGKNHSNLIHNSQYNRKKFSSRLRLSKDSQKQMTKPQIQHLSDLHITKRDHNAFLDCDLPLISNNSQSYSQSKSNQPLIPNQFKSSNNNSNIDFNLFENTKSNNNNNISNQSQNQSFPSEPKSKLINSFQYFPRNQNSQSKHYHNHLSKTLNFFNTGPPSFGKTNYIQKFDFNFLNLKPKKVSKNSIHPVRTPNTQPEIQKNQIFNSMQIPNFSLPKVASFDPNLKKLDMVNINPEFSTSIHYQATENHNANNNLRNKTVGGSQLLNTSIGRFYRGNNKKKNEFSQSKNETDSFLMNKNIS